MSIFQKIIDREIPADIVFEDDQCLAFRDIQPQAPVHILVIPKENIRSLADINPDIHQQLMGHLLVVAHKIAEAQGISESGYRTIINTNKDGGQTVFHLHLHILGGVTLSAPMN